MTNNYWRIGIKSVDMDMFKKGYPYHDALADAEACARLLILAVNTNRDLKE